MHPEPIQQIALWLAGSAAVFFMAVQLRPGKPGRASRVGGSRVLQECGLGILSGGFVTFSALAFQRLFEGARSGVALEPSAGFDPFTLGCVVVTLLLLCAEPGRWTGHRPATLLAALVPWFMLPEWGASSAVPMPTPELGLVGAAVYRVVLSGARSASTTNQARHAAVEATGDGVLVVDAEGALLEANPKGREAFAALAIRPGKHGLLATARLPETVCALFANPEAQHFSLRNASDRVFEIWLGSADRGQSERALLVRDVSDQRKGEQHLLRLAHYDSLTGLANRRLFIEQLERALKHTSVGRPGVALLYIDLDRFKEINDTLGHGAGDELLRVVASRFQEQLRASYPKRLRGSQGASVARLGGDEFAVIVTEPESPRAIEELARGLLQSIGEPMMLNGREITGSGSIGIALYPKDGQDVETLVKHADSALYGAKRLGRNRYERYQPQFSREADRIRAIEQELRGAIKRGEFELHYQPKIDVPTSTVAGFEALLRWKSEKLGHVGPDEFIPIAEERGLIAEIGAWCLEETCQQLRSWRDAGFDPVPVAVNVSSAQFIGSNLQNLVKHSLQRNSLEPELLEVELTERLLLEDNEQTASCLSELDELGVPIALDDFGTGYSALTYLNRFPLSIVKMDRGLLQDIETSDSAAGIVGAVISMCHSLGLGVVAEGVDAEGQLSMLQEMGCDQIQGFLFAPALDAAAVTGFLAAHGQPRPVLTPKPVAEPSMLELVLEPDLEIDPIAWQTSPIESDLPRTVVPRALLIDDTGAVKSVGERLGRLGVEVRDATSSAMHGGFNPARYRGVHLVVAPANGDLRVAREVIEALSSEDGGYSPSLLVVGDDPDRGRVQEIRESTARWVLWAPFEDAELRFLVRAAMPQQHGNATRNDTRIPMDAMAWLRAGSRRDVGVLSSLSRRGAFIDMAEPLEEGTSMRLEFELPSGRIATFAKVVYRQHDADPEQQICAGGIGVTFYGLDPASEFTIGEIVEANAAKYRP